MALDRKLRGKIIHIIDEEDAWEHVIFSYILDVKSRVPRRKNREPDLRSNIGRLAQKLASLNPTWEENLEE